MAIVAIDIDGVLAEKLENGIYPDGYRIKKEIKDALISVMRIKASGHTVKLFTARREVDRAVTVEWLKRYGFEGFYDALVMDKLFFDVLIDDRALRFTNWRETYNEFRELEQGGQWH